MKKTLFSLLSATALLWSTSCSEEAIAPSVGEEAAVQFKVELADGGVASRAISDGTKVNKIYYEVYSTTTNDAGAIVVAEEPLTNHDKVDDFNQVYNLSLSLVKGQTYKIVFWAQYEDGDNKAYDATDLTKITVLEAATKANDETRDAFTACYEFTVNGAKSHSITLTRPFAQVNFGTADWNEATQAGLNLDGKNSKIVVSNAATKYNALTEYASDEGVVTFDLNPVETNLEEALTVSDVNYKYLANAYVLVPGNYQSALAELEMTLETNLNEVPIVLTVPNAPIRRNYRTNVLGNLLTNQTDFTVVVDARFGGDINKEVWDGSSVEAPTVSEENENIYEIATPNQLAWLAAAVNGTLPESEAMAVSVDDPTFAGKTFRLTEDIYLNNEYWTPIGSSNHIFKGTFDGQGHTIYDLNVEMPGKSNAGLFGVTTDGEIKDFTVENAKVTGRLNVGVVAGTPYTSKYTDITVQGHVEVNGMAYVGGVGGKNAYADWTNVTVAADETSYVKAHSIENGTAYRTYVGGVCGFNGEGSHKFSNITSNIDVQGSTCDVGGLFGIAHYGNIFENCVCTGDVEIYAAEEAEEAQQIGGIAGVWHNENGYTVTFTNCSFDDDKLKTNIEGVEFYNGGLVGKSYSDTKSGKLIINGKQYANTAAELQAAINAAAGETTIYLGGAITGDVTVVQKPGVKITIDGEGKKYNGQIKVHSNSYYYADAALTIKNVNFETSTASMNVIEALENGSERYSSNITVEGCTFTATGDAVNTSVAVQVKATRGVTVTGCTATDMHSLIQAQSCDTGDVKVINCTVNGKNGVAFKQVKSATVEGTTITALAYGIRFDGNIDNYGIVVKNNDITAEQPLIVRKMTGANNTIALEGANTLTTEAEYQIVVTNGSDDEEYVMPTGTYTLTGADSYKVFPTYPAMIGQQTYNTLAAAVAAVKEGETIVVSGTIEEGTIKLPATLKNVTFQGKAGVVLKDMTISAADGNAYNYQNLTFDGLTFDNSRIILTGWRNGEEIISNLTVTNCTFRNIYDTTNNAAVHINKDASEAVNGFIFTNNVIDGATGGSKSGIYAQVTGNVVVSGNVINNVSFRPYVIQVTTDDGIADSFVVTGNTFSGSKAGRAQGLGNNAEGTDQVNLVVSQNIFKGITESQQICYWNFNAEKTTAALSHNYYDIDIAANPSRIYYNKAASSVADLVEMGVYPIYTELNADGTINENSLTE